MTEENVAENSPAGEKPGIRRGKKRTLRSGFTLLFGVSFCLVLAVSLFDYYYLHQETRRYTRSIKRHARIDRISKDISLALLQQLSRSLTSFSNPGESLYPEFEDDCSEVREKIREFQRLDLDMDERMKVEEINVVHQDMEAMIGYADTCKRRNELLKMEVALGNIISMSHRLSSMVSEQTRLANQRGNREFRELNRTFKKSVTIVTITGLLSLSVFYFVSFIYIRKSLSTLNEVVLASGRVGKGDFAVRVPEGQVIEIDKVLSSFNVMTDALLEADNRRKTNKLESIGILAGGIAHDFNNMLMSIYGSISLAKLQTKKQSEVYELLGDAEKASIQAKELTRQLLTFARGGGTGQKNPAARHVNQGIDRVCPSRIEPELRVCCPRRSLARGS